MAPSILSSGGYYYSDFEDQIRRSRTPEFFSRSYYNTLSEATKPFVKIEELDNNTNAVISRRNYSYVSSPLVMYKRISYTSPATYVAPSSLVTSDYFPYRSSYYNFPWFRSHRSYYPSYSDMSYYLARLLPYYYHPRPVYHTTYAPHYHYTYESPRTRVTRTTRTYHIPAIMPSYNYSYALTTSGYY